MGTAAGNLRRPKNLPRSASANKKRPISPAFLLPECPCGCLTVDQRSHDRDRTVPGLRSAPPSLSLSLSHTLARPLPKVKHLFPMFHRLGFYFMAHATVLTAGRPATRPAREPWQTQSHMLLGDDSAPRWRPMCVCVACVRARCFDGTGGSSLGPSSPPRHRASRVAAVDVPMFSPLNQQRPLACTRLPIIADNTCLCEKSKTFLLFFV